MIIHKCSCGKEYDKQSWNNLHHCGYWRFDGPDDERQPDGTPFPTLDMRNCTCGSTRALELNPDETSKLP